MTSSTPRKKLAEKWRRPLVFDDVSTCTCTLCNRDFVNARTLPCMHSFCEGCLLVLLQTYERQKRLDRTFNCPVCQVRIFVPCHVLGRVREGWLRMFPEKNSIDKLKEAIVVVEEMCSPCSDTGKVSSATAFCEDCQMYLCNTCHEQHVANPQHKLHVTVDYVVKEMKNVPIANISKFNCRTHKSLRYTSYCELHETFLCNTCKESAVHRKCRLVHRVIETTGRITKAETKLNVINTLKRDEQGKGKQLLKLIEQIDRVKDRLENCKRRQVELYYNYVMQASLTEQKTEATDALKGKLEFVKRHQTHDVINSTMLKVDDILSRYVDMFPEVADSQARATHVEIIKGLSEVEKILSRQAFDKFLTVGDHDESSERQEARAEKLANFNRQRQKCTYPKSGTESLVKDVPHVCKRHVDDTLDEETFLRLGSHFRSVGAICFNKMAATAFRVGSAYIMTAAHNVRDIVDPERVKSSDWSALEDPSVYLTFESHLTSENKRFRLCSKVAFLDDSLNVAVLEVAPSPEALPPPLALSRKNISSVGVSDVAVIGYGHRGSVSKHLDTKCAIIQPESDRAKQAKEWLKQEELKHRCSMFVRERVLASTSNWHYQGMDCPHNFAIDCCMEYRALGAPALTNTGTSCAEVLGILTHSVPDCYSELPADAQARYLAYRLEIATKTSSIFDKIALESRALADDIFIKDKTTVSTVNMQRS